MRIQHQWLIAGAFVVLFGCDDPTPTPKAAPPVVKNPSSAEIPTSPQSTGKQDAEGAVKATITLLRDSKAIDLKTERLTVRWISDREQSTRRGVPIGTVLDRQGAEASAVVQREPGVFQIGHLATQEEMEKGWDEPGSTFWSWTFRPDWKAVADAARFQFNLVSEGIPVTLKTTDGTAVPGARVVLMQDGAPPFPRGIESSQFQAMLVAGSEGEVHFRDVPEGRYALRVSGELDEERRCMRSGIMRFLPPSEGSVELLAEGVVRYAAPRIQELNRRLRVSVTEAGKPLADQQVSVELDWHQLPGDGSSRASYEIGVKTGDDGVAEVLLVNGWANVQINHGRMGLMEAYAVVGRSSDPVELACMIPDKSNRSTMTGSVPDLASFPGEIEGRAIRWMVFIGSHGGGDPDAGIGIPFHSTLSVPLDAEGRYSGQEVLPGKYDVMLRGSLLGEATAETVALMTRLMESHGRTVVVEVREGDSKEVRLEESP